MKAQEHYQYERIAEAIDYIREHFREQPDLDAVAQKVHLSPFHFQRLFKEWAGISPKKFLQFISLEHAKSVLQQRENSVFDAAYDTGLSGTGRLHDLFVNIEGMTPGEYKNGGEKLSIKYSFSDSPFGKLLVANTAKGICHLAFAVNEMEALSDLKRKFPNAQFLQSQDAMQDNALRVFSQDWQHLEQVKLHLQGTDFQIKVWETLLKIPEGSLSTYAAVARQAQHPKAMRAVGTAIGQNPVAFLIPCHRVIRSEGKFGEYRWGSTRKTAIIGWEMCHTN